MEKQATKEIVLNYWKTKKGNILIERVYLNLNNSNNTIGYIEKVTAESPRQLTSYYNNNRVAKGDAFNLAEALEVIGNKIEVIEILNSIEKIGMSGCNKIYSTLGKWNEYNIDWYSLAQYARGGYPNWYGNSLKKDIAKNKKERDSKIFNI